MIESLSNALRHINKSLKHFGGGTVSLELDIPILISTDAGHEIESTVTVNVTEDGVEIKDPDNQARRLAAKVAQSDRSTEPGE